jgi:hypothetical protein
MTNTPAYYNTATITAVNFFIVQAPGSNTPTTEEEEREREGGREEIDKHLVAPIVREKHFARKTLMIKEISVLRETHIVTK